MERPPIILRAQALDVLDQLHDDVRRRRKTREQPKTYERIELWERQARRRFGPNKLAWRWRCHQCGTVFSAADYVQAGAPLEQVGVACLGRWEPRVLGPDGQRCVFNGKTPTPANPITVHTVSGHQVRMLAFAD